MNLIYLCEMTPIKPPLPKTEGDSGDSHLGGGSHRRGTLILLATRRNQTHQRFDEPGLFLSAYLQFYNRFIVEMLKLTKI